MNAIVAFDQRRGIGEKGILPWPSIKEDMRFFQKQTSNPETGGILLMGRKTYESIGSLKNRIIYVLTKDPSYYADCQSESVVYVTDESFKALNLPSHKIWVCGGAEVYRKYLPQCDAVYATLILDSYVADTYLDPFEDQFPNQSVILESKNFWIVKYEK